MAAAVLASLIGCGNTYRPVVSAFNPVGPAGQPTKYAVVISTPAPASPGLVTFVDFSGDTVLITANIGVDPYYLVLNSGGNTGYTLNTDKTLTSFDISTQLLRARTFFRARCSIITASFPLSISPEGAYTYITAARAQLHRRVPALPAQASSRSTPSTRPSPPSTLPASPMLRASTPSTRPTTAATVRSPPSRPPATPSIPPRFPSAKIPSTVS